MAQVKDIVQNTPEWLKFREGKVGASMASTILGINPWQSKYHLWEQMVGIRAPTEMTEAMQRGHDLEEMARHAFNAEHGKGMIPAVYQHDEYSWMIASLDGISFDGSEIVEIKCPGAKTHQSALDGKVPEHYYAQVQHQLYVSGAKKAYYFSFDGSRGRAIEIYPNEDFIKRLVREEKEFIKCVISLKPPGDDAMNQLIDDLRGVRQEKKLLEIQEDVITKNILDLVDEQGYEGNGAKVKQVVRLGTIDYNKIPELKEINLEAYRKESTSYWKISLE